MSSSQAHGSQSESNNNNNDNNNNNNNNNNTNASNSNNPFNKIVSNQNESVQIIISEPSTNESSLYNNTELPQPAITRTHQFHDNSRNSSMIQILDEIPPPPYSTDSNMQIPSPSHSRDHSSLTITSPPEYDASNSSLSTITTEPQAIPHPSNYRSSDDPLLTSTKFCKICQESEEPSSDTQNVDDDSGKLISPCKCKGSLEYVHIGCLNKWRHSNVRAEASYRCEVCKYEYKFYRPRIAKILANSITLHFFTLILLLFTISVLSYMVKSLHFAQDSEDKSSWKNIKVPFLNLHLIHVVIGTSIFSFFGIIFFIIMGCLNGFRSTRRDFCYCTGCENACFCGYGGCYAGDCGGGGNGSDCGGVIILALVLIIAAVFMFGIVGGIVAAYLFAQKITTFFLEKVHDNILEVSKDD